MATPTYTPIANVTLTTNTKSVIVADLSQAYRDIVIVGKILGDSIIYSWVSCNGYTAGDYPYVLFSDYNGALYKEYYGANPGLAMMTVSYATASSWTGLEMTIMDYSATDKHKVSITRSGNSTYATEVSTSVYKSNSAITSFEIKSSGNFAAGTSFAIYGIAS